MCMLPVILQNIHEADVCSLPRTQFQESRLLEVQYRGCRSSVFAQPVSN